MRGPRINGCQAGTCASVNVLMDHPVLFPLFLAHFLSSLLFASFCVSQAVLFTCLSSSCLTLCASLSPLFFAACSGWQRVLALIDSSWRQSLVLCAPLLAHVAASLCVARVMLPFSKYRPVADTQTSPGKRDDFDWEPHARVNIGKRAPPPLECSLWFSQASGERGGHQRVLEKSWCRTTFHGG